MREILNSSSVDWWTEKIKYLQTMILRASIFVLLLLQAMAGVCQDLTLAQTLDYIQKKTDLLGEFDQQRNDVTEITKLFFRADSTDQCRIYLREQKNNKPANSQKMIEDGQITYILELKNMDKEAIDIYGSDGYVKPITLTLRAKNSSHVVKEVDQTGKIDYDFKVVLPFRANVKDMERLKKAYIHAISICESRDIDPFD